MARGPNGEWRPADPVARAVHIGRIATGQIEETFDPPPREATPEASERARKAGKASAASRTPEERRAQAKAAATARWGATT